MDTAALDIGGISVFLFLFAWVVECSADVKCQANSLQLIFHLIEKNPLHADAFHRLNGYNLIFKVLCSVKCMPSIHILKVLLDSCVSVSIFDHEIGSGRTKVIDENEAIITNADLLHQVIYNWRIWDHENSDLLGIIFSCLNALIRESHPFKNFNFQQLQSIYLMDVIVLICKERFYYEEKLLMSSDISKLILKLISKLVLNPPINTNLVMALCDLLLLLHKDTSTYISTSAPGFYYIMSAFIGSQRLMDINVDLADKAANDGSLRPESVPKSLKTRLSLQNKTVINEEIKHRSNSMTSMTHEDLENISFVTTASLNDVEEKESTEDSADDMSLSIAENFFSSASNSNNESACDEVDRRIHEAEDNLSSSIWYAPLSKSWVEGLDSSPRIENHRLILDNRRPHSSSSAIPVPTTVSSESYIGGGSYVIIDDEDMEFEPTGFSDKQEVSSSHATTPEIIPSDGEDWDFNLKTGTAAKSEETNALVVISVGLLKILHEVILVTPIDLCRHLLSHVIDFDQLMILCHHHHAEIRSGIISVLNVYLKRAGEDQINSIIKKKSFHMLSNQLYLYPVTAGIIEACFSIVLNQPFSLSESIDFSFSNDLKPIQLQAVVPILSLLPKTNDNTQLCHSIITALSSTLSNMSHLTWSIVDLGLNESLLQTLLRVLHGDTANQDMTDHELIFSDIKQLLNVLTLNVMRNAGSIKFQALSDLLHLFSHCERQEMIHCGVLSKSVAKLREYQIQCLQGALDHIQMLLNETNSTSSGTFSFFETVGQKFKSSRTSFIGRSVSDLLSISSSPSPILTKRLSSNTDLSRSASSPDIETQVTAVAKISSTNMADLAERFDNLIHRSCNFIVHRDSEYLSDLSRQEICFLRGLLHLTVKGMATVMERTRGKKRSQWSRTMWSVKDTLRAMLGHLLTFAISPLQKMEERYYAVTVIVVEDKAKDVIKAILSQNNQVGRRIAIFLHDMLYGAEKEELDEEKQENVSKFVQFLSSCGQSVIPPPPNTIDEWAKISEDKKNYIKYLQKDREVYLQHKQMAEYRLRHKYDSLVQEVSKSADNITQDIALKKNYERKLFIEHVRKLYMNKLEVRKSWQNLRDQLTHERAVWFFKDIYPTAWQLDVTEGPHRLRNRLERCHLNLRPKFFMAEHKPKSDLSFLTPPLEYLIDDEDKVYDVSSLLYRLSSSEVISFSCQCTTVTLLCEASGEILIGKTGLHFIADSQTTNLEAYLQWKASNNQSLCFFYEEITELLKQRYQLVDNALEIFLTTGKTYLIYFESIKVRDTFFEKVMENNMPNIAIEDGSDSLPTMTQMWRDRLITNFEYLTHLNKFAGRSCNDLMQYPVFPFVLSDYSSHILNLSDSSVFRNFAKSMAIQDSSKEAHFVQMYEYLKTEHDRGNGDSFLAMSTGPYHYSSLYSNSGSVLHFMVRLPPYTSMLISYQDNNFDIPDRTFHSMNTSWRLSSSDSVTDVKELVPEFFFLPEFFLNSEGFDFGVRQSGERVDDVILPNWCRGNARLFVLIHRQALESDYVTEHISQWIDLIFGFKQSGRHAVDAINVFHPITNIGLETLKSYEDPINSTALLTMIKTYGQMPKQLFFARHPMVSWTINNPQPYQTAQVIPEVLGLKWGSYVGSPTVPAPVVVWRRNHSSPFGAFVPLVTNDVFGLKPSSCLIVSYAKEKGSTLINTAYVSAAALLSWGHCDGILRVKFKKDNYLMPIIKPPPLDMVTVCASIPDCKLLFVGYHSGNIDIYSTVFDPAKPQLDLKRNDTSLKGHQQKISAICIAKSFSIIVTSSHDGTVIVWDLNKLSYVRYFDDHDGRAVELVSVSNTTGDIASVSTEESESYLKLHTINGSPAGTITMPRKICSICFSNAPEGISVNVIAGGMDNGIIKLWSTWDLCLVTEIRAEKFFHPVVCLAFSHDSQHLYAANNGGAVVIWEKPTKGFTKTPKFLPLL